MVQVDAPDPTLLWLADLAPVVAAAADDGHSVASRKVGQVIALWPVVDRRVRRGARGDAAVGLVTDIDEALCLAGAGALTIVDLGRGRVWLGLRCGVRGVVRRGW